jgi:hypothetical protein
MVQGAISPERVDYFADGKYTNSFYFNTLVLLSLRKEMLKNIIRGYVATGFLFVGVWLHGYTSSTYVLFS